MRRISPIIPAFLLCFVSAVAAHAHELWIEPLEWQVEVGSTLEAHVINGEDFAGNRQPYLPNRIVMFNLFSETRATRIQNRSGNTPALEAPAHGEGLHIAAYQSTPMTLNYDEWEKFVRFVEHKDLGDIGTMHDARGLSRDFFIETYTRFSKTLFAVGNGAGSDRRVGLETELVALTNPYTDAGGGQVQAQLFYQGQPRADAQIEVFEKASNGGVRIFLVRTNGDGIASVPVRSGHDYMLDAVVLREPTSQLASVTDAVWETLWANLTFHVP